MTRKLNWQAVTMKDRIQAIDELKEVISKCGGCIVHSNFFSDLALSLTIEIEEHYILNLYSKIKKSVTILESAPADIQEKANKEWLIYLNVSFGQGKGDLKIEIPDVPG